MFLNLCDRFLVDLCQQNVAAWPSLLTEMDSVKTGLPCQEVIFSSISQDTLQEISNFLVEPRNPVVERSANGQTSTVQTLAQILLQIQDLGNIHNQDDHTCDFHTESLSQHLIMVMLIALTQADSLQIGLTALLHDIGKVSCLTLMNIGELKVTAFPFHGEIGSAILQSLWNPITHGNYLSQHQWADLCRTVCVHMCGYHDLVPHPVKANMFRLERPAVQQLLLPLSVADSYGNIPRAQVGKQVFADFLTSRENFQAEIEQPFQPFTQGLLIFLNGPSCSGKSYLSQQLQEWFHHQGISVQSVSRDEEIVRLVAEKMGRPAPIGRLTGAEYNEYYQEYAQRKLSREVNENLRQRIWELLQSECVVIVDTVLLMYPNSDSIIPGGPCSPAQNEIVRNTFKMSVWLNRNDYLTEDDAQKNGVSLNRQLVLTGSRSLLNPFPAAAQNLRLSTSLMTSRSEKNLNDWKRRHQPHIVFTSTWGQVSLGQEEIFDFLERFTPHLTFSTSQLDTSNLNLNQLVGALYQRMSIDQMGQWFIERKYTLRTIIDNKIEALFSINYIDGVPRDWSLLWNREARGYIIYLNKQTGETQPLSVKLQSGAESLTGMQIKVVSANQEQKIEEGRLSSPHKFDLIQQATMKTLLTGGEIDAVLTGKRDGSLIAVNVYSRNTSAGILAERLTRVHGDEFAQLVLNCCADYPFLVVISTRTTLWAGDNMQSYIITALAAELGHSIDIKHTYLEVAEQIIPRFIQQISEFSQHFIYPRMTLCFEAITENRRDAWNNLHQELATCYPTAFLSFLGMTDSDNIYHPHFEIESLVRWDSPAWWKISSCAEIEALMSTISEVIYALISIDEFWLRHPPHNTIPYKPLIDFEGFVGFVNCAGKNNTTQPWDYFKVKVTEYYIAHKFHEHNVEQLLAIPQESWSIFPLAAEVANFFRDREAKLTSIAYQINNFLETLCEDSVEINKLSPKVLQGYTRAPDQVKKKIVLANLESEILTETLFAVFQSEFGQLVRENEAEKNLRSIVITLFPWEDNLEKQLNRLKPDSMMMRRLLANVRSC